MFSLCFLNFECRGALDLAEIYQFGPWKRFAFDFRQHPFLRTQLYVCLFVRKKKERTNNVFSLSFLHFDGLHSLHLVRRWLQVRTPMQTLRFELSPLHFCSPPPHRNTSDSRTTVEPNAEGKTCNDELSTSSPLWRVPLTRTLYFIFAVVAKILNTLPRQV